MYYKDIYKATDLYRKREAMTRIYFQKEIHTFIEKE